MKTDDFPDEQLLISTLPWYVDIVNFLVSGLLPPELTNRRRSKFIHDAKQYYWDESFLFKHYADQIIQKCVPDEEIQSNLYHCHSAPYGGHFGGMRTTTKVLQSGFYWLTLFKDAHEFFQACDCYQRIGNLLRRYEMPLQTILEVELFDVWGIDFMGPFPPSWDNWVEAVALPMNDAKSVWYPSCSN
ncbi:Transposon Ty3-I Gag-Pol polyprotein [Gossypium australe]|uniref:Transposon Ty3-I Gag-Pol polyprotein n=1 Tax=Gossypium australe TaxID=47621 RepID=A0A5B6X5T8_9ROSI|nr:Transposon Ty3-I Gag-Pol polyprotein [Gossypium australe]